MDHPSITVVIPCWNAEKWILRAIKSLLDQNYPTLDIIVVDDGSTDKSLELIKSFGNKIHYITGPNHGAFAARNQGLELNSSNYILFLDADDYLEPGSLAHWVDAASVADADIVLGPFAYEHGGIRSAKSIPLHSVTPEKVLRQWLEARFTPCCSVLWRRAFLVSIGGWRPLIRGDDAELVMRALIVGARLATSGRGLGVYVQHGSPDRVSTRTGREVLNCDLDTLRNLLALARSHRRYEAQSSFAKAFYRVAYEAFANRIDDVGEAALNEARVLGLSGHVGPMVHRVLSRVLGLRLKLRFTGFIKGRR
jgi:glycosyltransferase involved in cell wall biosynthesis